jgi:PAS domain S-box-containing protein
MAGPRRPERPDGAKARRARSPRRPRGHSTEERLAFLTLLMNTVEQAVIATDQDGRIRYWNRFAERLYGWEAAEVVGKDIREVLLPKEAVTRGNAVMSTLSAGKNSEGEWTLRRRDGSPVSVHATSTMIRDDKGTLVGIVGVSWDVSERKRLEHELHQSEIRLRVIAEQLPATAWATDADLKVVWNAGAAFRQMKVDPTVYVGKTISEIIQISVVEPDGLGAHERALRGETVVYEGIFNGVVLHAAVQPFRDPEGRIVGTVGAALDVTSHRRVESELEEKREQLQALSRRLLAAQEAERRALARELHDDFGQMLTAIRLNLEASRRGTSGQAAQHLNDGLAIVDQAIDRVRSLALELRPAMLDDLGLVAALRWLLKRQAQRAGFSGRIQVGQLDARLPAPVETCCFRLVQEALTNVGRHAGASRVDVELNAIAGELRILIRDDGRGFDVRGALRLAARGVSLGLLSMHERVTLAGGRLHIASVVGQGTTIDARVPFAAEAAP